MKKHMARLLAAILVLGMSATAYASTTPPTVTAGVHGIHTSGFSAALEAVGNAGGILHGGEKLTVEDLAHLVVRPGDEVTIKLAANMFLDEDGNPFAAGGGQNEEPVADISLSALTTGKITVKTTKARGGNMAEISLAGNRKGAHIRIGFSDSMANVGGNFDFAVYLASNGSRMEETRIDIVGSMETDVYEIGEGESYFDASYGDGVKPTQSIRDIVIDLGNNVTITRNLARGRTYYGVSSTELLSKDSDILEKYPGITEIYRLQTSGLKTAGNIVRFDLDNTYHVYNTYGLYLGTTGSSLPYWTTYYISSQKYDFLDIPE